MRRRAANGVGRGRFEKPTHQACHGDPGRGPFMLLQLDVREGVVERACFDANDCPVAIAVGSALVELVTGRSLSDAAGVQRDEVVALIGPPPPGKTCYLDAALELSRTIAASTAEPHTETNDALH